MRKDNACCTTETNTSFMYVLKFSEQNQPINLSGIITPTLGKSMYPAGIGWWNVPEGVTIPVTSLSIA